MARTLLCGCRFFYKGDNFRGTVLTFFVSIQNNHGHLWDPMQPMYIVTSLITGDTRSGRVSHSYKGDNSIKKVHVFMFLLKLGLPYIMELFLNKRITLSEKADIQTFPC